MKNIAVLTSGGDAPGMNAAIRAVVKSALHHGIQPLGITDGYQGLIDGRIKRLHYSDVNNIIQLGGTILGTARCEEFKTKEGRQKAILQIKKNNIEGLVVIGGDGSFTGANILSGECNLPIIGLPGTIDNDIYGTDATIGYDTALNTVVSAIDKIRDTATSHHRIFFVEVMGRDAGFIALNSAIASGAESVLIPEEITDIPNLVEEIKSQNKGQRSSIIVVAEGDDAGGAIEIMNKVKVHLPEYNLRATILGHIQRGGSPSFYDRSLATRLGVEAVEALLNGESKVMLGISNDHVVRVPINESITKQSHPATDKRDILQKLLTSK